MKKVLTEDVRPLCKACGPPYDGPVVLCDECVDLGGVVVRCRRCKDRKFLTIEMAADILDRLRGDARHAKPGVVLVFLDRCPDCRKPNEIALYPHAIYVAVAAITNEEQ